MVVAQSKSIFFFEKGDRRAALNEIYYWLNSDPGLILLSGATGSGQSFLFSELEKMLKRHDIDSCFLSEEISSLETEEDLYRALAQGFGLEDKQIEILEDLVDRVEHFIRQGLHSKRKILIAVDDVRLHADDIVQFLLRLMRNFNGLTLLLSVEPPLLSKLDNCHKQDFTVHNIMLRPLSVDESFEFVCQYLMHEGASYEDCLDRIKKDELMVRTGGNLSLLANEAKQLASTTSTQANYVGIPTGHIVAFVLVVLVTVLIFLFYPENVSTPDGIAKPDAVLADHHAVFNSRNDKASQNDVIKQQYSVASELSISAGAANSAIKEVGESDLLKPTYTGYEEELLKKPDNHMTLQLMNLSSEDVAKRFIDEAEMIDKKMLGYYRRGSDTNVSFIVLYGDYPSKQAALDAVDALPPRLKKASPWPRSIFDIQQELISREK